MKNTFLVFASALLFTVTASAQSTVDSIAAKYQLLPMPQATTIEKTFPVLGSYQLTTSDNTVQPVTVSLDPENKGIVWVEGLPVGKFKAYLKQAPATYRVIAQKSATGKSIAEGTLMFDPATNALNVALGKAYNSAEPASVFNLASNNATGVSEVKVKSKQGSSKTKQKVMLYTAIKSDVAANGAAVEPTPAPAPSQLK